MKSVGRQTDRQTDMKDFFHNPFLSAISIKEHKKLVLVSFFVGFVFVVEFRRATASFTHTQMSLKRSGNH
jgi:hypothetical protein